MKYDKQQYATDPEYRKRRRQQYCEWYRKRSADPAWKARRLAKAREAYRRRCADPEYRKRFTKHKREYNRKRYATDPEYREKIREYLRFFRACRRTGSEPLPESAGLEVIQAFEYEEFDHVQ